MYRVLVTGDRNWSHNSPEVWNRLDRLNREIGVSAIIEGCARGVDRLAEMWALNRQKQNLHFPADWDNPEYRTANGKSFAGNVRNGEMITFGEPDLVYAFHHDYENSKGTKDMVTKAVKAGIEVLFCD